MTQSTLDLADKFYGALSGGDYATCERLFAENAVVWHNFDLAEQPADQAVAQVAAMSSLNARFVIIERQLLSDGWLQQHQFHVEFPDGDVLVLAAVQRAHVHGSEITRIDEYMDTGQLGQIIQRAQSAAPTPAG